LASRTRKFNLTEWGVANTFTIRAYIRLVVRALDTDWASGFSAYVDWSIVAVAIGALIWSCNRASLLCKAICWVLNTLVIRALEVVGAVLGTVVALISANISGKSASVIETQVLAWRARVRKSALAERANTAAVGAHEWIKESATVAEVSVGIDDGAKVFVDSADKVVLIS
jgi:hypothetical protein